jgi:two-component system, NtrC family, nitrogen regulation sensor histidine kinase NtrY
MPLPPRRRLTHDQDLFLLVLLAGLPAVIVAMWHLWYAGDQEPKVQWTLTLVIMGFWLGFAAAVKHRVIHPLHTMANLLSALREGDFSIRARGAGGDDALGEVMAEINSLSSILQEQRLGALEATALLRTVMEEIDVAIFAFDGRSTLRLVNRAGQELLAAPAERILGRDAGDLGLADCLTGDFSRVLNRNFPGGTGRWGMRRQTFREGGLPHSLIIIADLSQPLREEELKAWQRLVRVIGHELNNSLAPIKSLAGSLGSLLRKPQRPVDWEQDMRGGLEIIEARADSLNRFMQSYAQLARLPSPNRQPCELAPLLRRVASLETRLPVQIIDSPDLTVSFDAAQIEQAVINLIKNAVEATLESVLTQGRVHAVRLGWKRVSGAVEIFIEDDGPGIANSQNLFVPFFTTKPEGSGIGLLLCRQVAENHGGAVRLENRTGASGCVAVLRLPM